MRTVLIAGVATIAVASGASAVGLAPVGNGFDRAVYVAQASGEQRLLVATQSGVVRPITAGGTPGPAWLDLRERDTRRRFDLHDVFHFRWGIPLSRPTH